MSLTDLVLFSFALPCAVLDEDFALKSATLLLESDFPLTRVDDEVRVRV